MLDFFFIVFVKVFMNLFILLVLNVLFFFGCLILIFIIFIYFLKFRVCNDSLLFVRILKFLLIFGKLI